jgi:hypothetical protein
LYKKIKSKSIEEIPEIEKLIVKGDNSHWCCAGVTPVNVIQKTQLASDLHVVAYQVITGYRDCGTNFIRLLSFKNNLNFLH